MMNKIVEVSIWTFLILFGLAPLIPIYASYCYIKIVELK